MAGPDFWNNRERAQADVEEVSRLKSLINPFHELEREVADFDALRQLAEEENNAPARAEAEREVSQEHERLAQKLAEFELRQFLSGENDRANAFLTIHSGAGGTESCDWADMLLRMYQRWIERHGYKSQTVDIQTGEEVGIKSATLLVTGEYAFGYLNTERGVHRLVRISPFDANKRRHTSFASVDVVPEIAEQRTDRNQSSRPRNRHFSQRRQRRAECEQSGNGGPDRPQTYWHCGRLPGGTQPAA